MTALTVGALSLHQGHVQAQQPVQCEGTSCEVLPGQTLLVPRNGKKEFRNLHLRGGLVKLEPGAQLTVSGTLLGDTGSLENDGKIVFRGGQAWGLNRLASLSSTGEIELNQTTLIWDGEKGRHSNTGKISVKGNSTLQVSGFLDNGGAGSGGTIEVFDGSTLIVAGDPKPIKTKGIFGGKVQVDAGGELLFAEPGGAIGSPHQPTSVNVDGELKVVVSTTRARLQGEPLPSTSGASGSAPPETSLKFRATPDPTLCSITGSLTLGTGTFCTTIKRVSTSPLTLVYGQFSVMGNFVLNGGTLKVLEDPSTPLWNPPSTANFDIIWADAIIATDGGAPGFTSYTERAPEYSNRAIVTLQDTSQVYRISDP